MGIPDQEISNLRILILGHSGLIGSHLLDLVPSAIQMPSGWRISDQNGLVKVLKDAIPDIIVNAVGLFRGTDAEIQSINGDLSLLAWMKVAEILPDSKKIWLGTAAEYGKVRYLPVDEAHPCEPFSVYGQAKWMASSAILEVEDPYTTIVRPSNVVGPGMSRDLLIGGLIDSVRSGTSQLTIRNPQAKRDYVDARDVARAIFELAKVPAPGIVNVCTQTEVSNLQVVEILRDVTQIPFDLEIAPSDANRAEVDTYVASCDKLVGLTGFRPSIDLRESIQRIWSGG